MALQEVNQIKQEQRPSGEFPDEVFLSIVARLSWNEICRLSSTWKNLCEGWTLHQMFFEEYSGARFQKPIGLFHGFIQSLPSMSMLKGAKNGLNLTFSVIAGDGYREPQQLVISQFEDVPTVNNSSLGRMTQKLNIKQKTILSCQASGCLVLLALRSCWIVMNPANGTARQIHFPSHSSMHIGKGPQLNHSKAFLNGIFQDEGSHYQILASFYYCEPNGNYIYMDNLPSDEDLGNPDRYQRGTFYNAFYLYKSVTKSVTKSWKKLLGSNICDHVILHDPVIYRGVIHAMLSRKVSKLLAGVKYVEEICGRTRWMPLSIPLPRDNILAAHLFVFQGALMIAGAVSSWPRDSFRFALRELYLNPLQDHLFLKDVSFACIWRLHEQSRSWMEVSRMPDHILYDMHRRSCCSNFWQGIMFSASGDYVMAGGTGGREEHPVYHSSAIQPQCMVVCNIVANHWQLADVQSQVAAHATNQTLTLFEPRFDILA